MKTSGGLTLILAFAAAGLILPVLWLVFYSLGGESMSRWAVNSTWFSNVLLFLWPSSVLLIADPEDTNFGLRFVSILVNVGFYGLLGYFAWLARSASKLWYFVLAIIIGLLIWMQTMV
jgi:hypothetical protein